MYKNRSPEGVQSDEDFKAGTDPNRIEASGYRGQNAASRLSFRPLAACWPYPAEPDTGCQEDDEHFARGILFGSRGAAENVASGRAGFSMSSCITFCRVPA
jgi:hypothetical protein